MSSHFSSWGMTIDASLTSRQVMPRLSMKRVVSVDFVADVKRLEQRTAAIDVKSSFVVALHLVAHIRGDQ